MATSFAGDVTGAYRPFARLSTTTMNTTAIVQTTEKYLHCNKRWLALLSIATIVILCAALPSGILSFLSIGPDVTDYLSALTRAYQVPTLSAVTGLVRLLVGWLEKLQNRNRFGAFIGFQLVGFEAL